LDKTLSTMVNLFKTKRNYVSRGVESERESKGELYKTIVKS